MKGIKMKLSAFVISSEWETRSQVKIKEVKSTYQTDRDLQKSRAPPPLEGIPYIMGAFHLSW